MLNHILIIGLGSIGRRHLRHFRAIGVKRIDALRSGKATLSDENQPQPDNTYYSDEEAFAQKPQAVVICTPSSLHTEYVLKALDNNCHVLCEKPLSNSLQDIENIYKSAAEKNLLVAVAHNLRFHPLLNGIKNGIADCSWGKPIAAMAHFAAYLPDWHPWENYKNSYAARKDLGGGSALTHIHEIDYLQWLFGKAADFEGLHSNHSLLDTDVDECTTISIRHKSGVISQVLLALNIKPASRKLTIFFTSGRLEADLIAGTATFTDLNQKTQNLHFTPEQYNIDETYAEQAKAFSIMATQSSSSVLCTIEEALQATQVALNIR